MEQAANHNGPSDGAGEPAPDTEAIPKHDAPYSDPCAKAHNDEKQDRLDRSMVLWTRVVGVFTAVLAIFGAIQTCAFIQSERAFVAVSALKIADWPNPGKPFVVTVELKNAGRSQGFVTGFNTTVIFLDKEHDLPDLPDYKPGKQLAPGTVLAGLTAVINNGVNVPKGDAPLILTSDDISAINKGVYRMYVFGYVRYRDEFSDLFLLPDRVNGFCQLMNPTGDVKTTMFINCAERAYTYSH